jgi:hypothetical protein
MSNQGWSINKAVSNVPAEGAQLIRIESIEVGASSESANNPGAPLLKFKGKVVSGDDENKPTFYVRSLLPSAIGMLARDLAATGQFDGDAEMPGLDDPDGICSVVAAELEDKVYLFDVKHREWPPNSGQMRADYVLTGPSNL